MEKSIQKERRLRLAFITPTKYIKDFGSQGNFQLGLSCFIDRDKVNEYEQALIDTKQDIILDCSTFELGRPEGVDSLIAKAVRMKASHFFAPDFLYDAKGTKEGYLATCHIMDKLGVKDLKIAVVVQGKTDQEYFDLYDYFVNEERVDLIGISILAVPRCFGSWNTRKQIKKKRGEPKEEYSHDDREIVPSRINLLERLLQRGGNSKNLHLLGLGDSYGDVIFAKENCPFVVSNDTSSCFQNGLYGRSIIGDRLIVEGGKVKEKVDFDLEEITKEQKEKIQENINQVKKVLCVRSIQKV